MSWANRGVRVLDHRRAGKSARNQRKGGFVAWDGEGMEINGRHKYVLMLSSEGDRAYDPAGLSTVECLETLITSCETHNKKYHVGFAFSYDSNMILTDLPEGAIRALWAGGLVEWGGYWLRYRARKELAFARKPPEGQKAKWGRVWDVFGFFQSSFVAALQSYDITTGEEIEAMKNQRDVFTLDKLPEIEAYCADEVQQLVALMDRFADYLRDADIQLTRYDGAGAVAAAFLRDYGVDNYRKESPEIVQRAAQFAYYGGRIEMAQFGNDRTAEVYQYDLRSAYPAALEKMPCLKCGTWEHDYGEGDGKDHAATLYHVRWNLSRGDICPFPWREPMGGVHFPRKGEGWYWHPEYRGAREAERRDLIAGNIEVIERWTYRTKCAHRPFQWTRRVYNQRREWKAAGVGAEKVLKLGLNSLYGKCAQRVGGRHGKPPRWHQLEWAGLVTSMTRAALYVASFPAIEAGAFVSYATDAIVSLIPLELKEGHELGEWELTRYTGLTTVQSGVYWLGDWPQEGENGVAHTRGFRSSELHPREIVAGWNAGKAEVPSQVRRFIAMGRALRGGKSWETWLQWITERRALSLWPTGTKRDLPAGTIIQGKKRINPGKMLVKTIPSDTEYWRQKREMTTPIALPWQEEYTTDHDPSATYKLIAADDESEDGWE